MIHFWQQQLLSSTCFLHHILANLHNDFHLPLSGMPALVFQLPETFQLLLDSYKFGLKSNNLLIILLIILITYLSCLIRSIILPVVVVVVVVVVVTVVMVVLVVDVFVVVVDIFVVVVDIFSCSLIVLSSTVDPSIVCLLADLMIVSQESFPGQSDSGSIFY